jgi:hypothetical protein
MISCFGLIRPRQFVVYRYSSFHFLLQPNKGCHLQLFFHLDSLQLILCLFHDELLMNGNFEFHIFILYFGTALVFCMLVLTHGISLL